MNRAFLAILILCTLTWSSSPEAATGSVDASEVQRRWANRLTGKQYTANVTFAMEGVGERRMTLRWDDTQKRERLLVRLEWPEARRGSSWLMLENNDRPNHYYYYSTARVSAGVIRLDGIFKGNPFAGGEFDYLGFRVARMGRPVATQVETTTLNGRKALVLTEEAREMHFEERKIWLDPDSYVPLRAEYWRNGKKFLLAETEEIRDVQGVATPIRIRFSIPDRKDLTSVWQVESIDYNRPILESYFTPPG